MHSSDWLDIVYSCFHKRLLVPTPVKSDFVPQDLSLKCDREKTGAWSSFSSMLAILLASDRLTFNELSNEARIL